MRGVSLMVGGSTEAMKAVHLNEVNKRLKDYGSKMLAETKKGSGRIT
jgi:hypothetical protein